MRILTVHNYYQQAGGEDKVFAAESALLEAKGHQVWRYTLHNDQVEGSNPLAIAGATLWNHAVYKDLRSLIRQEQIQIAHFHNTFPLVSPSAYYAAKANGVPVIQTFHNYRLLCPNALFFRDGRVCEDCLGKVIPFPGIQHGCYRGSQSASAAVTAMLAIHRAAQTWTNQVDVHIALTDFARKKFIQGGIPAQKVVVKPNFVHPDPGYGEGKGGYALYVGRLSPEKGIDLLLSAWELIGSNIPLKIVGDGPLAPQVVKAVEQIPGVVWLGRRPMEEVYALMKEAMFLVFPSKWYEGLPNTIIESFAVGTPVIASNLGAMSSLVIPERTGIHFHADDSKDLATKVAWALAHPEKLIRMRQEVRAEFIARYTAEQSYRQLMEAYALAQRSALTASGRLVFSASKLPTV